jgi:peptidoglycan DL-endopeptidase LytF
MQRPFVPIKLSHLLSLVVILILNGCASTPEVEKQELSSSPQLPATTEPPVVDTATYHKVERGETLYGIATRYGRNFRDVARWNNIAPPYSLNPGQRLRIDGPSSEESFSSVPYTPTVPVVPEAPPVSQPVPSPSVPELPSTPEGVHIVQAGETLSVVARQYGYSYRDVAYWNGIESPYALSIGQELIVSPPSGWQPGSTPKVVQKPVTRPTTPKPAPPSKPATPQVTSPSTQPTPSPADGNEDEHIVLPGDTLYKIAKHYGYSLTDLATWNGIQAPYKLMVGQKLRVSPPDVNTVLPPAPAPSIPAPSPTTPAVIDVPQGGGNSDYHVVAAGDTLYSISGTYGYSVSQLASWNRLKQPYSLSLGQRLRVTPPSTTPEFTPNEDYLRPVKLDNTPKINNPSPRYHVVQAGETLFSIAKQYGVSLNDLAQWNGIGSPYTVFPGLKLTISPP